MNRLSRLCIALILVFFWLQSVAQIAVISATNDVKTSQSSSGPKIKVFLLGGQSNMSGWSPLTEVPEKFKREYPEVMIWDDGEVDESLSRNWMNLKPGFGKNISYLGPELSFGPELARYFPHDKIALLKCSWAGTDLVAQWRPPSSGKTTGYLYNNFVKSVHDGLAALPHGSEFEIAGMIWMQGESDAIQTKEVADEYEFNLTNLIKDLRTEFKVPHMPFVIGQISELRAWDAFGPTVRNAQLAISKKVPNTAMIITTDFAATDPAHYSGMAQITLGERFATSVYNIIKAKGIRTEFFNSGDFGKPVATKIDSSIIYNSGNTFPDDAITNSHYAVRWGGYILPRVSGIYKLYIHTNNSVKLWVDDALIIDGDKNNTENTLTGEVTLNADTYTSIKLELKKNSDNALAILSWSTDGVAKQTVPSSVFYQNPLPALEKTKWTIKSCDSEIRPVAAYGGAKGVLDYNYRSFWKTKPDAGFPHEIAIDLGDTLNISALDYVPNQIDTLAGYALDYKVYTSVDGNNWSHVADSGLWNRNQNSKTSRFMPVVARYVKLQILSASQSTVSAADINVHGVISKSKNNATGFLYPDVDENILVYPNPVTRFISVNLNDFCRNENVHLSFFNSLGQSVFSFDMGKQRNISFDCGKILNKDGVYVLVVKGVTSTFKQKFIFHCL